MKSNLGASFALFLLAAGASHAAWSVAEVGNVLQIHHVTPNGSPQVVAVHLDSSYYRMSTGPGCAWGTSMVLWPSYWSGGALYQGAPVTRYVAAVSGGNLVLRCFGSIGNLKCKASLTFSPPASNTFRAVVTMSTSGPVLLDNRPNEAFKPVFFSSMYVNSQIWDSSSVLTDASQVSYPSGGWIMQNPHFSQGIRLNGGTSTWKVNAPTMTVILDRQRPVTGWLTPTTNPNDDNVGVWAASQTVLPWYSYEVIATSL